MDGLGEKHAEGKGTLDEDGNRTTVVLSELLVAGCRGLKVVLASSSALSPVQVGGRGGGEGGVGADHTESAPRFNIIHLSPRTCDEVVIFEVLAHVGQVVKGRGG